MWLTVQLYIRISACARLVKQLMWGKLQGSRVTCAKIQWGQDWTYKYFPTGDKFYLLQNSTEKCNKCWPHTRTGTFTILRPQRTKSLFWRFIPVTRQRKRISVHRCSRKGRRRADMLAGDGDEGVTILPHGMSRERYFYQDLPVCFLFV